MSKKSHDPLAVFPAALIRKVRADAEQDAVDVAEFIRYAASRYPAMFPDFPNCHLPREALLGINLVVRIQRWERNLITIHRDAGVPSANDVMRFVTSVMRGSKLVKYVQQHSATMRRLLWESVLWSLNGDDRATPGTSRCLASEIQVRDQSPPPNPRYVERHSRITSRENSHQGRNSFAGSGIDPYG